MKIIQNPIKGQSNNLSEILKTENSSKANKDLALIGKIIEATVLSVEGKQMSLLYNNRALIAMSDNSKDLLPNQKIELAISDQKDGVFIAEIIKVKDETNLLERTIDKIGVVKDALNTEIVDAMLKFNVPVTKENFMSMKQNLISAKTFLNEIAKSQEPLQELNINANLKEIVLEFIKGEYNLINRENIQKEIPVTENILGEMSGEGENLESSLSDNKALPEDKTAQIKKDNNGGFILNESLSKSENIKNEPFQQPSSQLNQEAPSSEKEELVRVIKSMMLDFADDTNNVSLKDVAEKIVATFGLQENAIFTKQNIELTLKNLFFMNQIKGSEKDVGQSFIALSGLIKKLNLNPKDMEELLNILKKDDNSLNKLDALSQKIKSLSADENIKDRVDKEMAFIKEASSLSTKLNEPIFYMQIPLKLDDYERSIELFYPRKSGSDNKDEFTVLIALNTINLGEVRCIVEKIKEHYILSFKLENEDIKKKFETNVSKLRESLDIDNLTIRFAVKSNYENELELKFSILDIKI